MTCKSVASQASDEYIINTEVWRVSQSPVGEWQGEVSYHLMSFRQEEGSFSLWPVCLLPFYLSLFSHCLPSMSLPCVLLAVVHRWAASVVSGNIHYLYHSYRQPSTGFINTFVEENSNCYGLTGRLPTVVIFVIDLVPESFPGDRIRSIIIEQRSRVTDVVDYVIKTG